MATDYAAGGIPPASYAAAAQKSGINKGHFWIKPQIGVSYFAFNHDRPLFKGANGTALAKAINYAIDRPALRARPATSPVSAPTRSCLREYPVFATRACTRSTARTSPARKSGSRSRSHRRPEDRVLHNDAWCSLRSRPEVLEFDLKQLGLSVNSHLFARGRPDRARKAPAASRSTWRGEAWIADYADPYDFINVLLSGDNLHDSSNNNVAYFNDPKYNNGDEDRVVAHGRRALQGVRQPGRPDDAAGPAVGGPLQLQRPHPGLEPRGLLHVQLDLLRRPGGPLPHK